ncbi:hypothetical protein NEMBOFW57_002573 [Staphylotrichum longicolle]|uniref:WLM domain-containing protein n=1 Tax=Staphylotrichum longicolle TaxID=669026 RepID=A0AAD4F897_9PEZI|nr:hypothetical protein NEMBOFW57_002573 [Staphylotrichum longicolle]
MSLEEYEPNSEFVGRNFNAGEVIQLVLKARSGHWLPFNYVQMVMMHELAHCKQMNHSRAFWAVRNQYAEQMRGLWTRNFTGEGLWGRGALLSTGEFEKNMIEPGELLPEHLCGGTYRSRGRKRKAKKTLTYQEQKERRILKKFGANGVALGDDPETKRKLEKGKTVAAKPRVAGSARGRELRAAAALARFEQQQKVEEPKEVEVIEVLDDGSETESGDDYEDDDTTPGPDALDINGNKLLDSKGRGMVKVCEDGNPDDQDAQDELQELRSFGSRKPVSEPSGVVLNLSGAVVPWSFVRPKTVFSTEGTVAVTPDGNYTFSVWISSDNSAGSNCNMFAGATPTIFSAYKVLSFSNVAVGAWQQLSVDFQAHASFLKVQMNVYCAVKRAVKSQWGGNTMYLDDALLVSRDP